jgi:hypothetical protein
MAVKIAINGFAASVAACFARRLRKEVSDRRYQRPRKLLRPGALFKYDSVHRTWLGR